MPRITIPDRDEAPDQSKPTLDAVAKHLGFVPNLHRLMSLSPAALAGWAGLQSHLMKTLDAKTRDAIALAVSEVDGCDYCLAAHSYVAENFAKMSPEEIALNREGRSRDRRRGAAVAFAKALIETRGHVEDSAIENVRAAGFSDAQIVEIIGRLKTFTVPLDLRGTPFQKRVWRALLTIPFGETRSYAQIAKQIGVPTAYRAVGAANGRNPLSIIAPCHRVIGSNGNLTGFAGGLPTKQKLLAMESSLAA